MEFDLNEDELLQLAEAYSIDEAIESLSRHWTEQDLIETRVTLKLLSEILDNTQEELEICTEDSLETSQFEPASPYLPKPLLPSHIRNDPEVIFSLMTPKTPSVKPKDRKGDTENSLNALVTVSTKLRFYHRKMMHCIQQCPPEESLFLELLELNQTVTSLLDESDHLLQEKYPDQIPSNTLAHISSDGTYVEDLMYLSHERGSTVDKDLDILEGLSSVASAAISEATSKIIKSNSKDAMSMAISELLRLFKENIGEDSSRMWADISRIGVLHALLCSVPKCKEWPDVEMQLSRAISMLVTFEDDWYLLRRGSFDILNVMLKLILVANKQAGAQNPHKLATDAWLLQAIRSDHGRDEGDSSNSRNSILLLRDTRALVSAALAKLTAILSTEWIKDAEDAAETMNNQEAFHLSPRKPASATDDDRAVESGNEGGSSSSRAAHKDSPRPNVPDDLHHSSRRSGLPSAAKQTVAVMLDIIAAVNCGTHLVSAFEDSSEGSNDSRSLQCYFDNVFVVLSIAVCNLSEVPQCRPHLASVGIIPMLKKWIQIGQVHITKLEKFLADAALELPNLAGAPVEPALASESSPSNNTCPEVRPLSDKEVKESLKIKIPQENHKSWMHLSELINNVAATMMYLVGGTDDCRFNSSIPKIRIANAGAETPCRSSNASSSGTESVIGWIDAQIVSDGLLEAMVSFVNAAVKNDAHLNQFVINATSMTSIDVQDSMQQASMEVGTSLKDLILPRAAGIHFAQTFCLFSKRNHNRTNLVTAGGLAAMNNLFLHAIRDRKREEAEGVEVITLENLAASYHNFFNAPSDLKIDILGDRNGFDVIKEQRHIRTQSQHRLVKKYAADVTSEQFGDSASVPREMLHTESWYFDKIDATTYMLSVSLAIMDAFTYFLVEVAGTGETTSTECKAGYTCELIGLLCDSSTIEGFKYLLSVLPRCNTRLSIIRVISSLSDWPVAREAMFLGDITDALVLISSEAEELHRIRLENRQLANYGMGKTSLRRNVTNTGESTVSSISVSTPRAVSETVSEGSMNNFGRFPDSGALPKFQLSIQNPNNMPAASSFSMFEKLDGLGFSPWNNEKINNHPEPEEDPQASEYSLEETLLVCYALANFCRGKREYLERIFDNGLPSIMLQLVKSGNMEISRQALRCVGAMCSILASSSSDKVGASRQSKNQLYTEILNSLNAALSSDISPLQKEAIVGVANLAPDECLHFDIINGPFRKVISFLLDHNTDADTRAAAENVLINIGFSGGFLDLELCYYDPDVMADWFYIRKSLKPQLIGRQLLIDWVNVLFGIEPDKDSIQSPEAIIRQTSYGKTTKRANEFANYPNYYNFFAQLHRQDSPSNSVSGQTINELSRSTSLGSIASAGSAVSAFTAAAAGIRNFGLPKVQKRLTHHLSRLLPFCLGRHAAADILAEEELAEAEDKFNAKSSALSDETYVPSIFQPSLKRRYMGLSPNSPLSPAAVVASTPGCDYYGIIKPTQGNNNRVPEPYSGLDATPPLVQDMLDLFYPSKLHQFCCCNFTNLRADYMICKPPVISSNSDIRLTEPTLIELPKPVNVIGFYFPPCSYQFSRIRRVVDQKMDKARGGGNKFALAFRDDSFVSAGTNDFYTGLLQFLCRCPDVVSLSFSCHGISNGSHIVQSRPLENAFLGHFAGNLPPSVRFITFRGVLSTNSLQAFCILVMKQNAAFLQQGNSDSPTNALPITNHPQEAVAAGGVLWRCRSKGLIGVAITHTMLTANDLASIRNLLALYNAPLASPKGKLSRRETSHTTTTSISTDMDEISNSAEGISHSDSSLASLYDEVDPRGIHYLDLSSNNLLDVNCAEIIEAASRGPLEALELGDNYIYKGVLTLETIHRVVSSASQSYLRHLGLSSNMLTGKFMCSLLDCLQSNQTLTSLDLSNNELQHSSMTQTTIRNFLRRNKGLRILDLSFNKLTAETTNSIYLGLLENETMLLMLLANNIGAGNASEFGLVQEKLFENRMRYKLLIQRYKDAILGYNTVSTPPRDSPRSESQNNSADALGGDISQANSEQPAGGFSEAVAASSAAISKRAEMAGTPVAVAVPMDPDLTIILPQANALSSQTQLSNAQVVSVGQFETNAVGPRISPREINSDQHKRRSNNSITVFFSAPLAWRDRANRLHPLEVLDYSNERDALVQVLREVNRDISIVFEFATTDTLRTALSFGCRALHFSGHGHPQCLNFEDGRAGLQLISVEALRNLLRAGGLKLDFVFVSACHSRKTGEAFIEAGVPHVVCVKVNAQIEDNTAAAFTRAFYLNLFSGRTVQQSFDIAKEALKASPYVQHSTVEVEKFVLLPENLSPNHHKQPIFNSAPCAVWPDKTYHMVMGSHRNVYEEGTLRGQGVNSVAFHHPGCNSYFYGAGNNCLPITTPDFEGREVDMYRVISTLLVRKQVTLVGEHGVGKSSLTAAVCLYVADRGMFPDGVLFMRAHVIQSVSRFLVAIVKTMMNGPANVIAQLARMNNATRKLITDVMNDHIHDTHEAVFELEQLIVTTLSNMKVLLVVDHIDELLSDQFGTSSDLKIFLSRLFERCKYLKLMLSSTTPLASRHVTGFGTVENCITLGPLTLRNSVRLFARLAPSLLTSMEKTSFITALIPVKNANVTTGSRDLTVQTAQLLALVGDGHPATIVKLACESTPESVHKLIEKGIKILEAAPSQTQSPASSDSSESGISATPASGTNPTVAGSTVNSVSSTPVSSCSPSSAPSPTVSRSIQGNHRTIQQDEYVPGIAQLGGGAVTVGHVQPTHLVRTPSGNVTGNSGLESAIVFNAESSITDRAISTLLDNEADMNPLQQLSSLVFSRTESHSAESELGQVHSSRSEISEQTIE